MAKPLVDDLDRHIAKRLKKLRQSLGLSAQSLADATQSTQQQISRYENAQNKLSATQLYRIANTLEIPIGWFYQGYNDPGFERKTAEPTAQYQKAKIEEELAAIGQLWQQLTLTQRDAVLRLIESMT